MANSWRLTNNVLVPPGVPSATVTRNVVKVGRGPLKPTCPSNVRVRRKETLITLSRTSLSNREAGWLPSWTEDLEARGCIAGGEASSLAATITQSMPLEINEGFHLMYPDDRKTGVVELGPNVRLQVMSPIMANGARSDAPLLDEVTTSVSGYSVAVDARLASEVLGYENAWYSVQRRNQDTAPSIVPLAAERHIDGQTERVREPALNFFRSLPAAPLYRLIYKGGDADFTAFVVGGMSMADLDRRSRLVASGTGSCDTIEDALCVAIPKRIAVNPMVAVTVNGAETLLHWGTTVGEAIRAAGERQPESVLSRLSLSKPYGPRLAPLQFDPTENTVLSLILTGGETLAWK